jgi:hypothetical protein
MILRYKGKASFQDLPVTKPSTPWDKSAFLQIKRILPITFPMVKDSKKVFIFISQ